jgi:acetoin utilization deacetylase AcuC-like enzyme
MTSDSTFAYLTHPDCVKHDMGAGHPECPDRVRLVHQHLSNSGLLNKVIELEPQAALDADLLRVHSANYLERVHQIAPLVGMVALDPDTTMNPHTLTAAKLAAGAGVMAVKAVLAGQINRAFCNVRPPGHHAEPTRAMGFCFFNNIAIAAAYALANGVKRVAIIDWDVHHGNGTESWVAQEPRALMLGSFQHPFYPGTGDRPMADNVCNVPLPSGSNGAAMRAAVIDQWWPRIDAFAPELIFISAGFDAHQDDDMSALQWDDADYQWLTKQVLAMAQKHSQGRIVSMLEGGYDLAALQRCVADHVKTLNEQS